MQDSRPTRSATLTARTSVPSQLRTHHAVQENTDGLQASTGLRAPVEDRVRDQGVLAAEPFPGDKDDDENAEDAQGCNDRSAAPGLDGSTPFQAQEKAGREAEAQHRADPVERASRR